MAAPASGPPSTVRVEAGPTAATAPSFEQFYQDENRKILAMTAALTGDWAAAEDIVQESFAAAYRRWDSLAGYDRPGAWVRRVAINRATTRAQRRKAEGRAMDKIGGRRPGAGSDEPVVDDHLWVAVRRLSRRQAEVVVLVYFEDLSLEETAGVLGCTVNSVKTHLRRAREHLARSLADERPGAPPPAGPDAAFAAGEGVR